MLSIPYHSGLNGSESQAANAPVKATGLLSFCCDPLVFLREALGHGLSIRGPSSFQRRSFAPDSCSTGRSDSSGRCQSKSLRVFFFLLLSSLLLLSLLCLIFLVTLTAAQPRGLHHRLSQACAFPRGALFQGQQCWLGAAIDAILVLLEKGRSRMASEQDGCEAPVPCQARRQIIRGLGREDLVKTGHEHGPFLHAPQYFSVLSILAALGHRCEGQDPTLKPGLCIFLDWVSLKGGRSAEFRERPRPRPRLKLKLVFFELLQRRCFPISRVLAQELLQEPAPLRRLTETLPFDPFELLIVLSTRRIIG